MINYPFDTFAVPMEQVVRIHASSGTTGKPTVVGYTQNDIDTWANIVARSLRAAGGSAKDKIHVAYGYGLFTGGLGAHYGAERLGATVIPMSGGQTEKQAQLIRDFKPDMIMVTPSYCLNLIEELERQMGGDARGCSLRTGVFGAEPWTAGMRAEIERRLGITALDIYGLVRSYGPGRGDGMYRNQRRPNHLGRSFLPGSGQPGRRYAVGRRSARRTAVHHANQRSAAGDPLPHPRPDASAAGHRPHHAPDGSHQRPQRRHADYSRRQRLSHRSWKKRSSKLNIWRLTISWKWIVAGILIRFPYALNSKKAA
ncbi:Phenylacetate-coenzyme A ligase [Kluyvera cryocrescens]|uniref:Phenylacetate-coenzyme A ligase n=1 Tax=Kluyvera cryocrescens TaxID=580 RepID=A0A485CSW7_KLUCR|nr:Phenylacetate-coenzyme A ligase [Kluyvera cryocrescens]